ncbi:MAG: ActD-like protein [Archangium sp.]|nr:ActD-like protein [Archangium sp.]
MIADWMLERYRLGELSASDHARVAAELVTDEALRARLHLLAEDDAATLTAHPPARVAARVTRTAAPPQPQSNFRWVVPAFAVATALTVGIVVRSMPGDDEVRFKGDGPTLRLFRLAGKDPERLADGARVKPHDVVQVAFELSGAKHLVIVSVDGAGQTTLHWPLDGNTRPAPGFKALPQAFELDEAPGFERFFLVSSDTPLSVTEVLAAAKGSSRTGPLPLPASATQRSVLLDKVSP